MGAEMLGMGADNAGMVTGADKLGVVTGTGYRSVVDTLQLGMFGKCTTRECFTYNFSVLVARALHVSLVVARFL